MTDADDQEEEPSADARRTADVLGTLLELSHRLAPVDLPEVVVGAGRDLGGDVAVYLVGFEQRVLISMHDGDDVLDIDGTVAGRCYRTEQVVVTPASGGGSRAWIP